MLQILLASIGAGVCYRLGGIGNPWNTKWRDVGTPLFICLALPLHWSLLVCFALSFLSMLSYYKKKGTDATWVNWFLVGLGFVSAYLPYFWLTNNINNYIFCFVTIPVLVCIWSEFIAIDWLEEGGRGFITAFLLILFSK